MRSQAQRLKEIGGDEGFFAVGEGGGVAGEGVVVDAKDGGVFGAEAAGQEAGDEAGEEVAGAGGGHAGIAAHADAEASAGFGDEGVVAFEDGDGVVVGGDGASGGGAVALDVVRGDAEEAGGFAGVGGEDEAQGGGVGRPALFQTEFGEGGEGVGVDHGAGGLGVADEAAEEVYRKELRARCEKSGADYELALAKHVEAIKAKAEKQAEQERAAKAKAEEKARRAAERSAAKRAKMLPEQIAKAEERRARREAIDEANWQREKERGEEIYRKMQTDLTAAGVR